MTKYKDNAYEYDYLNRLVRVDNSKDSLIANCIVPPYQTIQTLNKKSIKYYKNILKNKKGNE